MASSTVVIGSVTDFRNFGLGLWWTNAASARFDASVMAGSAQGRLVSGLLQADAASGLRFTVTPDFSDAVRTGGSLAFSAPGAEDFVLRFADASRETTGLGSNVEYRWGSIWTAFNTWFSAVPNRSTTSFSLTVSDGPGALEGGTEGFDLSLGLSDAQGKLTEPALRGGTEGFALSLGLSDAQGKIAAPGLKGGTEGFSLGLSLGDVEGKLSGPTLRGDVSPFDLRVTLDDIQWTNPVTTAENAARAAGVVARVGWLFQVLSNDGTTYRFCSGIDPIQLLGHSWLPTGEIVSISPVEATSELDTGSARIVIDLSADKTTRIAFLQDIGPAPAVVYWIVDAGAGWRTRNFQAHGRLSAPKVGVDGKVTFEIGTLVSLLDRGINHKWSHEDQKRRDPDDDGLEYMAGLASNLYRDDWPPTRA